MPARLPLSQTAAAGFTLVEVAIVVLLLGILAAISLPKVLNKSDEGSDAAARRSLRAIRDAISLYEADWGKVPKGKDGVPVEQQIGAYLHGATFPVCPVGNRNNQVNVISTGPFAVGGTQGWAYNPRNGTFIINSNEPVATDTSKRYSDL